ncbi:MAG: electron transfer flavoprotein subunit beta/FixA family protein [Thermoplasmata archaeon]
MAYNIIVLIKVIPDLEQIKPDQQGNVSTKNLPLRIETLSENSIEAAVQLREKHGGKVTGIIFGTQESVPIMKKAYAMGVDDGVVITGYQGNDPRHTAAVLSSKIKGMPHDIIVMGNQSADSYTGLLPGLLAGALGYPLIGNAISIIPADRKVRVKKFLENKNVDVEAPFPAVISVAQEINEPRLPPVMQIMAAGRKQILTEVASISNSSSSKVLSNTAPKSERKKMIFEKTEEGVPVIIKVLKEELR